MKLLTIHYKASLCKEKKTLLRYFDTTTKQMYIKKIYVSGAVENGKIPNESQNRKSEMVNSY